MGLTTRARLYLPLTDEKGDLLLYARVRLYLEDGVTLYRGTIYRDGLSTNTYGNPFVAAPAILSLYFPSPLRLRLGIQTDTAKPEVVGEVIDVPFDADQTVDTLSPLNITGPWVTNGLLCALDDDEAFWKPLRIDHEHAGVAPHTMVVGPIDVRLRQAGTFPGATVAGADSGGWGAASSLRDATMLGSMADGYGRGTTAVGSAAIAEEDDDPLWPDGSTAVGRESTARAGAVALGNRALASYAGAAVGPEVLGGHDSVALGRGARPSRGGVAIGARTGALANGEPASIGLGANSQYGLPSADDLDQTAVLLGAYQPDRVRVIPWANPDSSQSESPLDEVAATMQFQGATVQLQRGLEWLLDVDTLDVDGDVALGSLVSLLGFYGRDPRTKQGLGEDDVGSGTTALDNLIYALRDLGLIGFRAEALPVFRADDLDGLVAKGGPVTSWGEHFGTANAISVGAQPPRFQFQLDKFNGFPTVDYDNGVYRVRSVPVEELRTGVLVPAAKHYVVVALHDGSLFGNFEGLVNLVTDEEGTQNEVFTTDKVGSTTWRMLNSGRYVIDGLDQTSNRSAQLGWDRGAHVYRMTHRDTWPAGRLVIGGPRESKTPQGWDRWNGHIAEIVAMDQSWGEASVSSMERGLAFKYGIGVKDSTLRQPAANFLTNQHDPMNGTLVFWDQDYGSNYVGKVKGRAIRVPKPIIYVAFCSIYISFNLYSFRGCLVGNWGNINLSRDYEIDISIKIGDLDGDGDIDVDVDFDVETETHVGTFSLSNNFTWSMGNVSCRQGYKICRIRHKTTRQVLCLSGEPSFRYDDVDVKVYTQKSDGTLVFEQTVPLWGDGTFKAWTKTRGKPIARIVERSTGNVLGTTEYQERALPRTQVYADDDPQVSFAARDTSSAYTAALSALAFCEIPAQRYRARHLLSTLAQVCNDDGSLNDSYSAVLPVKTARGSAAPDCWGAVWAILAVLRYRRVTGDGQFIPLAVKLADFVDTITQTDVKTALVTYFAFRDLAREPGYSRFAARAGNMAAGLEGAWSDTRGRFTETTTTDAESLWVDALGGLYWLARGNTDRARATVRQLKRYRLRGAAVAAPHYSGPTGVRGYKPYADGGANPHQNPPGVIDQPGTWAALLFLMRFGEPVGDDVAALLRWQQTTITTDPGHALSGAQFLRYSATATANGYSLRARPHVESAAWGYLLTWGGRNLLVSDRRATGA